MEDTESGDSLSGASGMALLKEGLGRVSPHATYLLTIHLAVALTVIGLAWPTAQRPWLLLAWGTAAVAALVEAEIWKHATQVKQAELVDGLRNDLEALSYDLVDAEEALATSEEELEYLREFVTQWGPEVMTTQLQNHSGRLGIEKDATTRVSFYFAHDAQREQLMLLGRYSFDPSKMKDPTRIYPAGEGCIGTAWRDGRYVPKEIDPHDVDPPTWEAAQCEKLGFPLEKAGKLRMKSVGYAAFRISTVDEHLGVLVVESTEPGKVDTYLKRLEKEMNPQNQTIARELVRFVLNVRRYLGDPSIASSLDF